MADRLDFVISLNDLFSGAANKVNSALDSMTSALDAVVPGLGEVAGVAVKAGAAFAGLAIGGATLAIHAAEAKQDTLDMLDAMLGSQEAAADVYDKINDLQDHIAISQNRATELARQLSAAGVTNADALTDAIKSIGQVESVLGSGAGAKIQNVIERASQTGKFKLQAKQLVGTGVQVQSLYQEIAARTGVGVKQVEAQLAKGTIDAKVGIAALTKVLDTKFGGAAEKQVLDIGNQFQRLKDNVSRLFEDVDTSGFLEELSKVLKVFDQSTESGKALKFVITSFFNGFFNVAKKVLPYVTTFMKGLVIIGLKLWIALKPLGKAFGSIGDQSDGVATLANFMSGLGDALAFVVRNALPVLEVFGKVISVFIDVESYLANLVGSFYNAGANLIGGLVNGIKSGASAVVNSVKDIGQSALDKFTGMFGIHSDSKVMAKMGGHLMGGLESGIAANDNKAQRAMGNVLPMPSAGPAAKGGTTTVTFGAGSIVIHVTGATAADIGEQLKQVLPGELAAAFESMGITSGAA